MHLAKSIKVIFASHNAGKIKELETILKDFHLTIIPQENLSVSEVPETALTFVENALIKARHASLITGMPAIADDSGLAVDALQGAPGIYSARFAGEKAKAEDNIKKLLHELQSIPDEKRTARFHCILVFLSHAEDPTPLICHGTWQGRILRAPQGEKGFGYDPIFFDPENQCSAAELPIEIKNKISHRGKALRQLLEHLREKL